MTDEEKKSIDQYGRRTWNVELYEKEAKTSKKPQKTTTGSIIPTSVINDDKSSSDYIKHRNTLLNDSLNAVKVHNLIDPSISSSTSMAGKNKRFGFFCPICNLSYRDNLALIDHFNSLQHVRNANELSKARKKANKSGKEGVDGEDDEEEEEEPEELEGGIRRATTKEVIATIEALVQKSIRLKGQDNKSNQLSFLQRVEKRKQFDQKRREKRREQRLRSKSSKNNDTLIDQDHHSMEIESLMGINSFGSSKK
ncbi:U4/U6.U5 snRNP associated protein [Scheffersomyces coipomensis]|uniref:U4/U6.U5 snRNP associated protein n=1 Tax=Scheffersomyces coipomensis TaxID=1788519 RepID=UPI00315DBCEA